MGTCALINDGGRRRPTVATGPHSRLLSIQQSTHILGNRLVLLKLEKVIIKYDASANHRARCSPIMIVVPPMQSISGNNNGTYTSYMSPVRSRYLVLRLGVDAHHARVAVGNQLEIRGFRKRFPYFKY